MPLPDAPSPVSLLNAGAGLVQAFGKERGKKCEEEVCSCTREVFGAVTCARAFYKPEAEIGATLSTGKSQPHCVHL